MSRLSKRVTIALVVAGLTAILAPASRATSLYDGFDLIVFGNMTGGSDVNGPAFIGGTVSGNISQFAQNYTASPGTDTFYAGDVSTQQRVQAGSAVVGAGATNVLFNGGGSATTSATTVSTLLTTLQTGLTSASTSYAAQTSSSNGSISLSGSPPNETATFTNNGSVTGDNVFFNVTGSFFTSNSQVNFSSNLDSANEVIINVNTASLSISSADHFGAIDSTLGPKVIWNFYNATSLTVSTMFSGSILAPNAAFSNANQVLGSVAVSSYSNNGEVYPPINTVNGPAPVPVPATLWSTTLGLGLIAAIRLKARSRA